MSKLLAGVTLEKDDNFNNYYFRFNGGANLKADMTQVLLWELLHRDQHSEPGRDTTFMAGGVKSDFLDQGAKPHKPGRIPEGYCLVPVEPTERMVEIGAVELSRHVDFSDCINPTDSEIAAEIYSDMIDAAPAPDADERDD